MYYLAWIISAGLAVTVGCFVATRLEKKEDKSK
ncbi:CydX/CbdX family cytochrome bd oxidase small subunit [Francisella sp. TX07-6608]|nr:CydX/CbdX family cytochrome bd oxidase small subunit [Francisella sp. TX07-6608]OIN83540.1 membrane bound YbgT-like family protein [Francisella sp. TX07-6608]